MRRREVDSSLTGLAAADKNLKETESQLRETEKKIAVLEEQLKTQQPTISTAKNVQPIRLTSAFEHA